MALRPELARDIVAGALPEGEAYGLDNRHYRESHAHGGRGLRADAAHVESSNDVVHARNEHTYNGGNGHCKYHPVHGRGGKEGEVVPLVHVVTFYTTGAKVLKIGQRRFFYVLFMLKIT